MQQKWLDEHTQMLCWQGGNVEIFTPDKVLCLNPRETVVSVDGNVYGSLNGEPYTFHGPLTLKFVRCDDRMNLWFKFMPGSESVLIGIDPLMLFNAPKGKDGPSADFVNLVHTARLHRWRHGR